jgi:hypothetical protein
MASFIGEMVFGLVRLLFEDWLRQIAIKFCTWLDPMVHGRMAKVVIGGLLGLAACLLAPGFAGLLGF